MRTSATVPDTLDAYPMRFLTFGFLVCGDGFATLIYGDVSERPKVPASKAGVARATEGSNPSVTASWVPGICIPGTSLCGAARRPQGAPPFLLRRSGWFTRARLL